MREVRGFEPWSKQEDMAVSLRDDRRVLAYTCNGAGKSTFMSEMILWFMSTRRNARVITTAGVGAQVRHLWRKIRGAHDSSKRKLPGEVLTTQWELGPEWYALGLSTDAEETMQGYHSWTSSPDQPQAPGDDGGLLACIDEASGVKPFVFNAMRGYMTTDNSYWLVMGNPNQPNTDFHRASKQGTWTRFQISAFDVPEHILSRDWIAEQRRYWGEDSPQYKVRVLGEFPSESAEYAVFPMEAFEMSKDLTPDEDSVHMGLDIARGQSDRNCAVIQYRGRLAHLELWQSSDLMATAEKAMKIAKEWEVPDHHIHVDVIGLGAGVVDRLREAGIGCDPVDFGGRTEGDWDWLIGHDKVMQNRRAELYWAARTALMGGYASVPDKYAEELWREAARVQYGITPRGALGIEPKEKLRSRLGHSPDATDAWILSFARGRRPMPFFI